MSGKFIIRDTRLAGSKPLGDLIEVDSKTPLQYIMDMINQRSETHKGDLIVQIMCHGLPGYLMCGKGAVAHKMHDEEKKKDPNKGNGITWHDLPAFESISGKIKTLELRACLVAYMGVSPEEPTDLNGFDGNYFCYRLAQTIQAEVKASLHWQWYHEQPNIVFQRWYGEVKTWGPKGNIIKTEMFAFRDPYISVKF